MKTRTYFAATVLIGLSFGCLGKKNAEIPVPTEKSATAFCSISFFSIGYGIDVQGLKSVQLWAEQKKDSVQLQQTPWGREGEVDACLLTKYTETEKQGWIIELKGLLENAKNCRISIENACRK